LPTPSNSRSFEVFAQGGRSAESPAEPVTVRLAGEAQGEGPPIVLLHGVSATRRTVVHGSRHLVRRGYRLIGYDARGHGDSAPAPSRTGYEYRDLVSDLAAVLDRVEVERPVLAGSSMGAATAMAFALEHPERVTALVQITPAYDGTPHRDPAVLAAWDRLADALEHGGVEGFVAASEPEDIPERWREASRRATRQRLQRHRHPGAVADALRVVPRSAAFESLDSLEHLQTPTLIVGSRDEADALHPLRVAQAYAERLPHSELVVEEEGKSPLPWQGARLSRAIAGFLERALPELVPRPG
jgi:pimeloyl-ACP methyl ester carboxylesterase